MHDIVSAQEMDAKSSRQCDNCDIYICIENVLKHKK